MGEIAKDTKPDALSNVSPCRIVREVMKADRGVHFDPAMLDQWDIPLPETRPSTVCSPPKKAAVPNDGPAPHQRVKYEERQSHHSLSGETDAADTTTASIAGRSS